MKTHLIQDPSNWTWCGLEGWKNPISTRTSDPDKCDCMRCKKAYTAWLNRKEKKK